MNNNKLRLMAYWIVERYLIHLRRIAGLKKPWTEDKVLQNFFFTTPYRELDKTTQWFRTNVRNPLQESSDVIMATIIFRWFNYIPTGQVLAYPQCSTTRARKLSEAQKLQESLLVKWNYEQCVSVLDGRDKICTGGYIINTAAAVARAGLRTKLEGIAWNIDQVWDQREELISRLTDGNCENMEDAFNLFENLNFPSLGGFMIYEVLSDLRWTDVGRNWGDIQTWAHPGLGARRGLNRLFDRELDWEIHSSQRNTMEGFIDEMRDLKDYLYEACNGLFQAEMNKEPKVVHKAHLLIGTEIAMKMFPSGPPKGSSYKHLPKFEMREIEHSLCEFDKYDRLITRTGKSKRKFDGR